MHRTVQTKACTAVEANEAWLSQIAVHACVHVCQHVCAASGGGAAAGKYSRIVVVATPHQNHNSTFETEDCVNICPSPGLLWLPQVLVIAHQDHRSQFGMFV